MNGKVHRYLAEIGRRGGKKGGRRRAEKLTAKARRAIALDAIQHRWSNRCQDRVKYLRCTLCTGHDGPHVYT